MTKITDHPINKKWPARDPKVLQLYSLPTPNGVKISIALEETAAGELVNFGEFKNVARVLEAFVQRPAVTRGLVIPAQS